MACGVYRLIDIAPDVGLRIFLAHRVFHESEEQTWLQTVLPEYSTFFTTTPLDALATPDVSSLSYVLSFDDGCSDLITRVAPLLDSFKIPYIVYLVPQFIKSRKPGTVSSKDVKQLASSQYCLFGSHGYSHVSLKHLSRSQLAVEVQDSKAFLEDLVGNEVQTFAYPYSEYTEQVVDIVHGAGYTSAITSQSGINTDKSNPYLLKRVEITSSDSDHLVRNKMEGWFDWHGLREHFRGTVHS